uniref:Putative secreted protein n=1 Tax=Anopheles triannulatus TaxID=58253 RepID=A0A2M4B145_9DIPT
MATFYSFSQAFLLSSFSQTHGGSLTIRISRSIAEPSIDVLREHMDPNDVSDKNTSTLTPKCFAMISYMVVAFIVR